MCYKQYFAYYDAIETTGEVVYCGKGTEDRIKLMKRNKKYNNIAKKHKLIRTIIPMLDEDLALKYEDWLMEYYHTWVDDPLATEHACNIDGPGTNGGSKSLSQETKNKIRKKLEGQVISEETKDKISNSLKGEKNPFFGKKHSVETCYKLSESHRNKKRSKESCDKQSKTMIGHKHSEETKSKISESQKGRKLSEETKEKIRRTLKNKERSQNVL